MGKGAQSAQTGWDYSGTIVQAVCIGPIDVLHGIYSGDAAIFTGPIYRANAADSDGKTTLSTTLGTVVFYWGTLNQAASVALSGLQLNFGAGLITVPDLYMRGVCYAVCQIGYGSQPTPPTISFDVERWPLSFDAESAPGQISDISIDDGGAEYALAPQAWFAGGGAVTLEINALTGVLEGAAVSAAGSGYVSVPRIWVYDPAVGGSGATLKAEISGGQLSGVSIVTAGSAYSVDSVAFVIGGVGIGEEVLIPAVTVGEVSSVAVLEASSGYTQAPQVVFFNGEIYQADGFRSAAASVSFYRYPITKRHIDSDAIIPEVIHELLTNTRYGLGVASSQIDLPSFIASCETIISEGIGVSPLVDGQTSVRDLISDLLAYINGELLWIDGQFFMVLNRGAGSVLAIDESDLTEEPLCENGGLDELWSRTIIKFHDRNNAWEETSEAYRDPAVEAILGESVSEELSLPWITTRASAKLISKIHGLKGGLPLNNWKLSVLPSRTDILVGSVVALSYAKFGLESIQLRVVFSSKNGGNGNPISLECLSFNERDQDSDYLPAEPPDAWFTVPSVLDDVGTGDFVLVESTPRIGLLPSGLKLAYWDGFFCAINRTSNTVNGATVYFTWSLSSYSWRSVKKVTRFPVLATVLWWKRFDSSDWTIRMQVSNAWDRAALADMIDGAMDIQGVSGHWKYNSTASFEQHEAELGLALLVPGGRFELVLPGVYDIQVTSAQFGSQAMAMDRVASYQYGPGEVLYIGRVTPYDTDNSDFALVRSNGFLFRTAAGNHSTDTDRKRYVKVTTENINSAEDLDDVTAIYYDQNDTTMAPDGTYSRQWGDRALTCYEMTDISGGAMTDGVEDSDYDFIEDVDTALGAFLDDTATAGQLALWEDVDLVLGAIMDNANGIYNDTP